VDGEICLVCRGDMGGGGVEPGGRRRGSSSAIAVVSWRRHVG
jgi:hypothetical protein